MENILKDSTTRGDPVLEEGGDMELEVGNRELAGIDIETLSEACCK